jgi:thioredoxin
VTDAGGVVALTDASWDAQVLRSQGTVVTVFWADWCVPCRTLLPALEDAAPRHPRLRFGTVDVDANPKLRERYGIVGLPTLLVLQGEREVARRIGLIAADNLQQLLASVGRS